jgi:hypothetical protein
MINQKYEFLLGVIANFKKKKKKKKKLIKKKTLNNLRSNNDTHSIPSMPFKKNLCVVPKIDF